MCGVRKNPAEAPFRKCTEFNARSSTLQNATRTIPIVVFTEDIGLTLRPAHQHADSPHSLRPLRARRKWPRRRPAEQRGELAHFHSITSEASASILSGTWRPSALAVVRLMTSSDLVGCSTGTSPVDDYMRPPASTYPRST